MQSTRRSSGGSNSPGERMLARHRSMSLDDPIENTHTLARRVRRTTKFGGLNPKSEVANSRTVVSASTAATLPRIRFHRIGQSSQVPDEDTLVFVVELPFPRPDASQENVILSPDLPAPRGGRSSDDTTPPSQYIALIEVYPETDDSLPRAEVVSLNRLPSTSSLAKVPPPRSTTVPVISEGVAPKPKVWSRLATKVSPVIAGTMTPLKKRASKKEEKVTRSSREADRGGLGSSKPPRLSRFDSLDDRYDRGQRRSKTEK